LQSPLLLLILLLALAIAVATYVILPLLRQRPDDVAPASGSTAGERGEPGGSAVADVAFRDAARTVATTLDVLRDRRRELEASLAHLPPDAPQRRAAMDELAAQAAAELRGVAASGATGSVTDAHPDAIAQEVRQPDAPVARHAAPRLARRRIAAGALAASLVIPAFALYLISGAPEAVLPELQAPQGVTLDQMADRLRERLEQEPDRADGWQLLGRTELARGRFPEAIAALERAAKLEPRDAGVKVDLADAMAQQQGARLDGRPIELIREALAIDPQHPKGLALAGAWSVGQRDFAAAIGHWELLLAQLPAGSPQAEQVTGLLADLRAGRMPGLASESPSAGPATTPPTPSAGQPPATAATSNGGPAGAGPAPGAGDRALRGRVELAAPLAAQARPGDTLFVVARALDAQGRPAGPPVALLTARVADLPLSFALDDSMAMLPSARLSGAERVAVVARVSRTGEATARSGDLQGASEPVAPDARGVRVLIDSVVP